MNKLPANACAYPFKAKMMMHGTPATPCCRFHDRFLSDADKNSDTLFTDIKTSMMRNEWHPGCYKCKSDEEVTGNSMRTEADEFFNNFTDFEQLEYLEITVGRLCNLACIGCGLEFSHKWDEDSIALDLPNLYKLEHYKKHQEMDIDGIDLDNFRHLKFLKVTGGEPFLHRQFLNLIIRLADSGLAKQIEIEIFTNSTWYPKKVDEAALLKFKKVIITASIDAHGKVNDVARYPAKWNLIETTLDKWLAMRNNNDKVEVMIACTVSVLNAPDLFDFMLWARIEKRVPVILQTVHEPNYLSIQQWPDWFKRGLKYTIDQQFGIDTVRFPDGRLNKAHKLLTKLTNRNSITDTDNSELFLAEMKRLFDRRGHSLNDVQKFKRIVETFKP
jgi:organic radical activating enzyme